MNYNLHMQSDSEIDSLVMNLDILYTALRHLDCLCVMLLYKVLT